MFKHNKLKNDRQPPAVVTSLKNVFLKLRNNFEQNLTFSIFLNIFKLEISRKNKNATSTGECLPRYLVFCLHHLHLKFNFSLCKTTLILIKNISIVFSK